MTSIRDRAAQSILAHFDARPGRSFTFSELLGPSDVSYATLQKILARLTDSGELTRKEGPRQSRGKSAFLWSRGTPNRAAQPVEHVFRPLKAAPKPLLRRDEGVPRLPSLSELKR